VHVHVRPTWLSSRANNNTGAAMAHWNKLKKVTNTAGTFRQSGKRRMKRLSKIMRSRHVAAASNVDTISDGTGRRYSYNRTTKEKVWLDEEVVDEEEEGTHSIQIDIADEESGATIEEQGERKQRSSKRKSFRKCVGDNDDDVYYKNVETGDIVLELPEDGDVIMF
jgi:hypothetical protein